MSLSGKIYGLVPVWVQNIGISIYGFRWQKRRFGGVFNEEYKGFKDREHYSTAQWADFQTQALRKMLVHSFENVPYYKRIFTKAGFTLDDFRKFELVELARLPYLEKEDLRAFGTSELISVKTEPGGEFFSSSGSTGTPTKILLSEPMHQRWSAGFEARIRNWAGLTRLNSRGMIGGRRILKDGIAKPPYFRYNFIEKQVYFSAYHISAETATNYMKAIKKYGIDYMTGYAASNFILARFFDEKGLKYPLKAVITSSEKLTPEMRDVFARVYGCKTYDSYSGVEDCGLISECEHGGLHVSPDMGIIEFLREDGNPAQPGEIAEMVCTGILNFDQPLIRYRIGDLAVLSKDKCACGRDMPLVSEIIGRVEDVVVGRDGREMVRFHGIFVDLPNVLKAQVIQHDYDDFEIKLVTLEPLAKDEKDKLKTRMESQLGPIKMNLVEVPDIPVGNNGKFKAVISKIKRQSFN